MPLGRPQFSDSYLVTAQDMNDISTQTIQSYASESARTAAYSGVPIVPGQLTFLRDTFKLHMWNGTDWKEVVQTNIGNTLQPTNIFGKIPPEPITATNQSGFWDIKDIDYAVDRGIYPFLGSAAITWPNVGAPKVYILGNHTHLVWDVPNPTAADYTITIAQSVDFQAIVIGGGGGPGGGVVGTLSARPPYDRYSLGAGGGAGGLEHALYRRVPATSVGRIQVGSAGQAANNITIPGQPTNTYPKGTDGGDSSFMIPTGTSISGKGGGAGGGVSYADPGRQTSPDGNTGGSSGGAAYSMATGGSIDSPPLSGITTFNTSPAIEDAGEGNVGGRALYVLTSSSRFALFKMCSAGGGGYKSVGTAGYINGQAENTWGIGGDGVPVMVSSETMELLCRGGFGGRHPNVDGPMAQKTLRPGDGGDAGLGSRASGIDIRGQNGGPGLVIIRFNHTGGALSPMDF